MAVSNQTWLKRQLVREANRVLRSGKRYIDFALEVRVVDRDATSDYEVPGAGTGYRILETHRVGGKLDTVTKRFVGPAESYLVLHAGPKQWQAIRANLDPSKPILGTLVFGGEGSGKSETAAIWALWIIVSHTGQFKKPRPSLLATAPTTERLETFLAKITERIPEAWATLKAKRGDLVFANGITANFRGTKKYSDDVGSRIQGYTCFAAVSDEAQDYDEQIDSDIEARGRGAPGGRYLRFVTATPKDSTRWRNYVGKVKSDSDWHCAQMTGPENPFVPQENWERMRRRMTEREFRRRVYGENLRSERATYYAFDRERNIKARPIDSRRDCTRELCGSDIVIGHDPGVRQDTSIFLKAYRLPGIADPVWFAVDEVITQRSTTRAHAQAVIERLNNAWVGELAIAHPDPHPTTEEASPENVKRIFNGAGLEMLSPTVNQIRKKDRIDMLNSLFKNASGLTRLYLDVDIDGRCRVPHLLESLEKEVRDANDKAEAGKKDDSDFSHAPSACAFALYRYERPSYGMEIGEAGPIL